MLLLLLTDAAIQVVYCRYMLTPYGMWILTPLFEVRRSVDRMNDQRTSYGTEHTCMYFGTIDFCLDIDHIDCEIKTGPI